MQLVDTLLAQQSISAERRATLKRDRLLPVSFPTLYAELNDVCISTFEKPRNDTENIYTDEFSMLHAGIIELLHPIMMLRIQLQKVRNETMSNSLETFNTKHNSEKSTFRLSQQ